ncbi:class I SAM-dependent methyltransferase [Mesorhizobium sp. M1204]|uniref:class I SAM-dependent methyltransferase n=2 Tax=unclassified Mesorhizobium TaxID=325217 RepID=UPI00333CDA0C
MSTSPKNTNAAGLQDPSKGEARVMPTVRGSQALSRLLQYPQVLKILDVGSGAGEHAALIRATGRSAFMVDLAPPADHVGDFMEWRRGHHEFDAVWVCHVLEHQPNPNAFLRACLDRLRPGGLIVATVPPMKNQIVGGHVTLWNAGLLLYQLILAGFDCRRARVGTYADGPGCPVYNISVVATAPGLPIHLPPLRMDAGDIERLAELFPCPVRQGFDGRLPDINW